MIRNDNFYPQELLEFEYYVKKCPLYLQNDENFLEHFRIWYDLLAGTNEENGTVNTSLNILYFMNIFDNDYLENINKLKDDSLKIDILEKLGNLFNVKRNFSVSYVDNNQQVSESLNLTDEEFLLLIKSRIIKNYSNGSYQQMREFYDKAGLQIYYKSEQSGSVNVILLVSDGTLSYNYTDNIKKMFKAGLLTIQSMGIQYNHTVTDYNVLLIWKENDDGSISDSRGWDTGVWYI